MCGKEDFLYHDNLQFIETLNKKGVSYKFEDGQEIMIMLIGIELLNVRLSGLSSNDTRVEFGYLGGHLIKRI